MKKQLPLFIFLSLFFAKNAFSQITINSSDIPVIGDVVTQYVDTLFGVDQDAGNGGPNQTWDYAGSLNHVTINTAFVSVASTPYASTYPTANIASTTDSNIYLYMNTSPSIVTVEGLAGPIVTSLDTTHMNPSQTLYQLPFTYLSNFTDTYKIDYQGDGSAFGVYAFRYVSHGVVYDSTDGFGILKTPMGTYDALRVKRWEISNDSIFIKLFSDLEPWSLFQGFPNTQLTYKWFANGIKMPVAEVATDGSQNPTTFTYSSVTGTFGIEPENLSQIKVGPNPAIETITIFMPEKYNETDFYFQLTDISGKVVYNKLLQSTSPVMIDISMLEAGAYLYSVQSGNEKFTGKIVKE